MHNHNLKLFSGSSHPELAAEIAKEMDGEVDELSSERFADGSFDIQIGHSVRGTRAFVVQTMRRGEHMAEDILELQLIVDALKRSHAEKVYAVIPYLAYSRSDALAQGEVRKPLGAKVIIRAIEASGADQIIMTDLHARQIQGFCEEESDHLHLTDPIITDINEQIRQMDGVSFEDVVLVAPDTGAAKSTGYRADQIGPEGIDLAIINKKRPRRNVSEVTHVVGDVEGMVCIVIDDIIDTAGTVCSAKKALIEQGADPRVLLYGSHAVLSPPAIGRLIEADFTEVVVTNSLPLEISKEDMEKIPIRVISIAPMLAEAIRNIRDGRSVSKVSPNSSNHF
jgi:ribose-phosphate pyrophosphokinase